MEHMKRWLLALVALLAMTGAAGAQTTGTNTVTLIADNLTNANGVLTPLIITIGLVLLIWGFAKKRARGV